MSLSVFEREPQSKNDSAYLLGRLSGLHPNTIDLSLDRVDRLLKVLGSPHRSLPPVVHVAGTNGKGSQIAFLRSIGEALGKRIHVYTSPHLMQFHERIVLNGAEISERRLVEYLRRVERANAGDAITSFEITTVAAFLAFSETPADLVLLETGMGGRLDATNVVEQPLATVITPISIDHASFLGNSVSAIAKEKAGILKEGALCVVGRQTPDALSVIQERANQLRAPLIVFGRDFEVERRKDTMCVRIESHSLELPLPALLGAHQIDNAATAIAAASFIYRDEFSIAALKSGVTNVNWPARLQLLAPGRFHDYVEDGTEIWLDGGHNPAGAQVIASALKDFGESRPIHLIWGMVDTKDASAAIAPFKDVASQVFTVPIPAEPSAFPAEALSKIARDIGIHATATTDVAHALRLSRATLGPSGRVLIFGSLYLAGHVLQLHGHK